MFTAYLKHFAANTSFATAAWLSQDCSTADNPLHCRLLTWLNALEAIAGVLAFILIVAAIFAFAAVRRNKARKLEKSQRP